MSKQTGYNNKQDFIQDVNGIKNTVSHYNNKMAQYNAQTKTKGKSSKIAAAGEAVEKKLDNDLQNAEHKFTNAIDDKGAVQQGKDSEHNQSLTNMAEVATNDANNLKKLTNNSEFRGKEMLDNIADALQSKAADTHDKMKQVPGDGDYSNDRNALPVIDWERQRIATRHDVDDTSDTGYTWRSLQPDDVEYFQKLGGKVPNSYHQQAITRALTGML